MQLKIMGNERETQEKLTWQLEANDNQTHVSLTAGVVIREKTGSSRSKRSQLSQERGLPGAAQGVQRKVADPGGTGMSNSWALHVWWPRGPACATWLSLLEQQRPRACSVGPGHPKLPLRAHSLASHWLRKGTRPSPKPRCRGVERRGARNWNRSPAKLWTLAPSAHGGVGAEPSRPKEGHPVPWGGTGSGREGLEQKDL